jgi:peptidyl-dipeptidase Dcp
VSADESIEYREALLSPWTGPCGGFPPFDKVKVTDLKQALLAGIEHNRAEIAAIVGNNEPADFENTIAALEDAGRPLDRVRTIYYVFASAMNDKAMQAVETEMAPILAAFSDEIIQNSRLFARIQSVYDTRDTSGLTDEQRRVTWVIYRRFARHGAALDDAGKKRLAEINQRLAALYTQFSQNELADEENHWIELDSEADLAGMSRSYVDSAKAAAAEKGLNGRWVIANSRSAVEPFLIYADRRALREKAFRIWASRGDNGGAHDNNAIITEILALRAEKAGLLGHTTFAHWIVDDQMAKTPDVAMDLMLKVWAPAVARAREEVADMQQIIDAENGGFQIAPWDYRYYAEKVRKGRFDLDDNEVRPYLQLENIQSAAFWVAGQLFGLAFAETHDAPVYAADVRTFEVRRDGRLVGIFYLDSWGRPGKQSGAWMSEYRTQERFRGDVAPIVSNNTNFVKAAPGDPVLISWDEAVTIFHEFGHALHALNSNVSYPSLSGTNVVRDFVEFPSQLFERWLPTHAVLSQFARHFESGESMPDAMAARIKAAHTFNQGFSTVEYLASAIIDMKSHLAGSTRIDPRAFEAATLEGIGMPPQIVMRHRLPHFGHIFAGEGYAAGYYNYIWADTLVADAAEAFRDSPDGFYDRITARHLHDDIMSVGNTKDAAGAFVRFRGREATADALMRDRGFPVTATAQNAAHSIAMQPPDRP